MKNSKNSHPYELMDYDDSSVSSKQPLFAHTHPAEPDEYTFRLSTTTSETTSPTDHPYSYTGLMGSLVLEEGHIYSLAAAGDLLFTGSDSKNIRVRKNQKEFSGFKSNSGLVKAIIIADERIFSGHQDGKIRVWKMSNKDPSVYKRIGTLPTLKAKVKKSFKPRNSSFSFCKSPVLIILKLFCVFHFVDFFFL